MNVSFNFVEPFSAFVRFFHSASVPPRSLNIMNYNNPEADRLIEAAEASFDANDTRCDPRQAPRVGHG